MVHLRTSEACQEGHHDMCSGGQGTSPGVFGGWMCMCGCHRKAPTKPQWMKKKEEVVSKDKTIVVEDYRDRQIAELREMGETFGGLIDRLREDNRLVDNEIDGLHGRIAELEEQWQDEIDSQQQILDDARPKDEVHCGCCAVLRLRIKELEATLKLSIQPV